MQSWALATEVHQIAAGARRFHNPLADGPPAPFPAYVTEPSGPVVEAEYRPSP